MSQDQDSQSVPIQPDSAPVQPLQIQPESGPIQPISPLSAPVAPVQIQSLSPTELSGVPSSPVPIVPRPVSTSVPVYQGSGTVPLPDPEMGAPETVHVEGEEHHGIHRLGPPPSAPVKKNIFVQYWNKAGGGSFMLSLLIHVVLLIAAYFIVDTITQESKVDFLPGGGSKAGEAASKQLSQNVQTKRRVNMNKSTPMRRITTTSSSAIALPDVPMDSLDMPEMSSMLGGAMGSGGFGSVGAGGGFGKGVGIGGQSGFVSLPPTLRSRCSVDERLRKLQESGGKPECERAVSNSLAWLKTQQNKDGSWGKGRKGAMTGFALLCYLGRCETPDSKFYGDNVMNGILYLIELQKKNDQGLFSENPVGGAATYEHGIATYALGEMYTLARMGSKTLPGMKEAFERGVEVIIKAQGKDGGWRYNGEAGTTAYNVGYSNARGDLSVTGWQYQALKAAKFTSLKIDGLHKAIDNTVEYLKSTQNKTKAKAYEEGGMGNTNREAHYNQWNLTGTGVLGLQTLGSSASSRQIKDGIKFSYDYFTREPPDWNKNANLYCWYYYAQAFFQNGGEEWKMWNSTVLDQLLANQAPDGSWNNETYDSSPGSTVPGGADRALYRTALCTLMLEVYYRYLKVGDKESSSILNRS